MINLKVENIDNLTIIIFIVVDKIIFSKINKILIRENFRGIEVKVLNFFIIEDLNFVVMFLEENL